MANPCGGCHRSSAPARVRLTVVQADARSALTHLTARGCHRRYPDSLAELIVGHGIASGSRVLMAAYFEVADRLKESKSKDLLRHPIRPILRL